MTPKQIAEMHEWGQSMFFSDGTYVGDTGVASAIVGPFYQEPGDYIEQTIDVNQQSGQEFLSWCLTKGVDEITKHGFPAAELIIAALMFCTSYSIGVIKEGWECGDSMPKGTFRFELGMQSDGSALLIAHVPFYAEAAYRVLRFTTHEASSNLVATGLH